MSFSSQLGGPFCDAGAGGAAAGTGAAAGVAAHGADRDTPHAVGVTPSRGGAQAGATGAANPLLVFGNDTGAPPGGALVPALHAPGAPAMHVGRRVWRFFGGKLFKGVVVGVRDTPTHGTLWRVKYDDGDAEDLDARELCDALSPDDAPRGRHAAPHAGGSAAGGAATESASHGSADEDDEGGADEPPHAASGAAPSQSGAVLHRRYKGVSRLRDKWVAQMYFRDEVLRFGRFDDAAEAARAYDTAARARGIREVNFPRPGELQAVPGQHRAISTVQRRREEAVAKGRPPCYFGVTSRYGRFSAEIGTAKLRHFMSARRIGTYGTAKNAARAVDAALRSSGAPLRYLNFPTAAEEAAAAVDPEATAGGVRLPGATSAGDDGGAAAAPPPAASLESPLASSERRYAGVYCKGRSGWAAVLCHSGARLLLGTFADAAVAARAVDAAARARSRTAMNFPLPGSGEEQAVFQPHSGSRAVVASAATADGVANVSSDDEEAPPPRKRSRGARLQEVPHVTLPPPLSPPALTHHAAAVAAPLHAAGTDAGMPLPTLPPARHAALASVPLSQHAAAHADAAPLAPVAAFLRRIAPPLSHIDALVAALPGTGVTMEHLRMLATAASSAPADRAILLHSAADALGIAPAFERFAFISALLALAPQRHAQGNHGAAR